jgi:hypothetical protein
MVYPIKTWWTWVSSQPWNFRWFILLVLLRPLIDILWQIKEPLFGLNILQVVGVVTPTLILLLFCSHQFPSIKLGHADKWFIGLTLVIMINLIFFFFSRMTLLWLGEILKMMLPFVLYPFLRHTLSNKHDLHGLLTTFLYSTIFPALLLLYELLWHPLGIQTSRGMERYTGGYSDVLNYAIYFFIAFLVWAYTTLAKKSDNRFPYFEMVLFAIAIYVVFLMYSINHITSLVIFVILFLYYLIYRIRTGRVISTIILFHIVLGFILVRPEHTNSIERLVSREIEVIKGERPLEKAFHGRMSRWEKMLNDFDQTDPSFKLFAPSFSGLITIGHMITGTHNDYLRFLFMGGVLGLSLYLLFLFAIWRNTRSHHLPQRFLISGTLIMLLLFSITSVPTLYAPLLYFTMTIFAYSNERKMT